MSPMMRSTFKNLLSPWLGGFLGILVGSGGQRTVISFFLNPSVWEGVWGLRPGVLPWYLGPLPPINSCSPGPCHSQAGRVREVDLSSCPMGPTGQTQAGKGRVPTRSSCSLLGWIPWGYWFKFQWNDFNSVDLCFMFSFFPRKRFSI